MCELFFVVRVLGLCFDRFCVLFVPSFFTSTFTVTQSLRNKEPCVRNPSRDEQSRRHERLSSRMAQETSHHILHTRVCCFVSLTVHLPSLVCAVGSWWNVWWRIYVINSINDRDTSEAITIARTAAMAWLENHQRTATQSTYHSTFHMFHSTPSSCGISQSKKNVFE